MSNPIPSQVALAAISNGTLADGSVVQANDAAIQTALNEVIAALSGGASGQFLKAIDGTDVVWEPAASLAAGGTQTFNSKIQAVQLGSSETTCSIASGQITISANAMRITATDATSLGIINGAVGSCPLLLINSTGGSVPIITGGGVAGVASNFTLLNGESAFLWYDSNAQLWIPLVISTPSGPVNKNKYALTYGPTVTPDASKGMWQTVTATNGTAFTIAAPSNPPSANETQDLVIEIANSSGGALGAVTLDPIFLGGTPSFAIIPNTKKGYGKWAWNGSGWVLMASTVSGY